MRLFDHLREAGFAVIADELRRHARTSVRLSRKPVEDEDLIAVGASKLGGRPDLGAETTYPEWDGKPLSFVGQIALRDVPRAGDAGLLPAAGLLSFFFDAEQEAWGFDPQHQDGWRVLYTPEEHALVRREMPADMPDYARFNPCRLSFAEEQTVPDLNMSDLLQLGLSQEEADALWNDLSDLRHEGDAPHHRMFGYADEVQGAMELECQLASHGIYVGGPEGYADPRARELEAGAEDWRLLLQVDTDEDATGMCWGDVGRIYFWIERERLARGEFERAWAVLQCY